MGSLHFSPSSDCIRGASLQESTTLSRPIGHMERNCDHSLKLLALRMMPLFSKLPPSVTTLGWVSGWEIAYKLREITASLDMVRAQPSVDNTELKFAMACANGVASQLHFHHITSHIASFAYSPATLTSKKSGEARTLQDEELHTTWCGLYITAGIYLHRVLGLQDPSEKTYHRYVIHVLKKALTEHLARMKNGRSLSDQILLWQILLGAMSVEMIRREQRLESCDCPLTAFFDKAIWEWSWVARVSSWTDARAVLGRIVWPGAYVDEDLVREIWERSCNK
ncbi:hypothetical protein FSARC_13792 [Fusarium sarcochroum]|uniref:Uncharacterized protein n=1 Tax=Fusarium sarcochroum TaxID=1208366 RepID=A0A8H4WSC9_9HYPO|nr:hypothetical protein FSARC_13792 [Fusarium sarcochroum]